MEKNKIKINTINGTVFTRHYRHGAILGFPRITPWRCLAKVCYNATGAIV